MHATLPTIRDQVILNYQSQDPDWKLPQADYFTWLKTDCEAGSEHTIRAIDRAGRILGQQVANLANLLNPQMIVFGGGTIYTLPRMMDSIRQEILDKSLSVISRELTVELSALGPDAALQGAALLAIYDILKNSTEKTA